MSSPIESYALIGNGRTAALVCRDGGLDWLCWPRFDSQPWFGALLGGEENGRWLIAPAEPTRISRRYCGETLILETTFATDTGTATLTDFMPFGRGPLAVMRLLRGIEGRVRMKCTFAARYGGREMPGYARSRGSLAVGTSDRAFTFVSSRPELCVPESQLEFDLAAGEQIAFAICDGEAAPGDPLRWVHEELRHCSEFWRGWVSRCSYEGPWRDAVVRSLVTLKALIHEPTGSMVAAPTTSLPEQPGGSRNWDYRYCWLRDATFSVLAFLHAGYPAEARAWIDWMLQTVKPERRQVRPVYAVDGSDRLEEWTAGWFSGFDGSRPVRFGNEAYSQFQLGVFGELQDTLHQWRLQQPDVLKEAWHVQRELLVQNLWCEPDAGIWEQRSRRQRFTESRVFAWVALDRAVKSVENFGFDGPVEDWRRLRAEIHADVCTSGFSERLGSFTRAYGSNSLDASALLLPLVGFLPASDPRMIGTVERLRRDLGDGPFVYRYDQSLEDDGIREKEGAFLACSFWLTDNLILQKREDEAAALFERLLGVRNDVGLLSEEYDVGNRVLVGNFPQALSHLSLVHTALNFTGRGPAHARSGRY
ncbi:MAG: glycoside hydrolase family 15 protein [Rhizomicrobium sp.]